MFCMFAADVARCLNGAVAAGCGFFSCLENSTCDTDGMHEICELFLHTAATFNTEVSARFSPSPQRAHHCSHFSIALCCSSAGQNLCEEKPTVHLAGNLVQGFPDDPPLQHFPEDDRRGRYQRNLQQIPLAMFWYSLLSAWLKVQEECYSSLDICTVARTNPDAIGDVVQVPTHFPNRSGTHTHTHLRLHQQVGPDLKNPPNSWILPLRVSNLIQFCGNSVLVLANQQKLSLASTEGRHFLGSNICVLPLQILQHPAADPAGLRRTDGGGGEGRPRRQAGARHGDLPPAGPEQTLQHRLWLQHVQQPSQLEKHARV